MEMDELLISTGVDSLIRLIYDKGKIETHSASKLLNLPQSTIEDWAHILEENGLISVEKAATDLACIWVQPTPEQIERIKKVFNARKAAIDEQIQKMQAIQKEEAMHLKSYKESIEAIALKFRECPSDPALQKELKAKKGDLDCIRASIADMNARSMMIEKNNRLLLKEAQLIELLEKNPSEEAAKRDLERISEIVKDLCGRLSMIDKNIDALSKESQQIVLGQNKAPSAPKAETPIPIAQKETSKDDQVIDAASLAIKPNTTLADIGGMNSLKNELKTSVEMFLDEKKSRIAGEFGISSSAGVLLYGPPGVGKSRIVEAIAGELNCRFMRISASDILNKWFGTSEKNMRAVFDYAARIQPAILFFDELEALGGNRADYLEPSLRTSINQFLMEMDNLQKRKDKVLVIGATNAPWHIDPALMRSGRFSKTIFVAPPDLAAREEIFRIYSSRIKVKEEMDCGRLAEITEGFSGANIEFICREAALRKYSESLEKNAETKVCMDDFISAIQEMKKKKTDVERWQDTIKKYGVDSGSFPEVASLGSGESKIPERMFG